jgi:hypothetical protein
LHHIAYFATNRSDDLEKKEKPIHTLDGHRLGVISVRANSTGTGRVHLAFNDFSLFDAVI